MPRLGDIATYINGYAFKPSDWSDHGIPIIRIQDLTGNPYQVNRYNGKYDPKYEVNFGDILISWSASLGVYLWRGEKAVLNQHIFKVVFDKVEVDKSFYTYQVQSILENAASQAHGATMKHLTKPVFDALPFHLPPKAEQQRISAALDKLSGLISCRKQQLDKLDKLVKARFVEMFGDPILNSKNLPVKSLGDVVTFQRGYDLPVQNRNAGGKIPVYGSNGVLGYHSEAKSSNGIITGRSGTIGRVYYCKGPYWPLNTTLFSVETYGNDIIYLSYLLSYYGLERFHDGTGVPTLNRNIIHKENIIDVPIPRQTAFSSFAQQAEQLRLTIQRSLDKLEALKRSRMQEYFG